MNGRNNERSLIVITGRDRLARGDQKGDEKFNLNDLRFKGRRSNQRSVFSCETTGVGEKREPKKHPARGMGHGGKLKKKEGIDRENLTLPRGFKIMNDHSTHLPCLGRPCYHSLTLSNGQSDKFGGDMCMYTYDEKQDRGRMSPERLTTCFASMPGRARKGKNKEKKRKKRTDNSI